MSCRKLLHAAFALNNITQHKLATDTLVSRTPALQRNRLASRHMLREEHKVSFQHILALNPGHGRYRRKHVPGHALRAAGTCQRRSEPERYPHAAVLFMTRRPTDQNRRCGAMPEEGCRSILERTLQRGGLRMVPWA